MTERPILFSGPMVRALLDGRKTQTRRIVKPQFDADAEPEQMSKVSDEGWQMSGHSGRWWDAVTGSAEDAVRCPYGVPGDALYVREAWRCELRYDYMPPRDIPRRAPIYYAADPDPRDSEPGCAGRLKPGIHMPRWASRLTLEITDVRVERLQDISHADARAEGCEPVHMQPGGPTGDPGAGWLCYRAGFESLWDSINGKKVPWAANPWVWAVSFRVERKA